MPSLFFPFFLQSKIQSKFQFKSQKSKQISYSNAFQKFQIKSNKIPPHFDKYKEKLVNQNVQLLIVYRIRINRVTDLNSNDNWAQYSEQKCRRQSIAPKKNITIFHIDTSHKLNYVYINKYDIVVVCVCSLSSELKNFNPKSIFQSSILSYVQSYP